MGTPRRRPAVVSIPSSEQMPPAIIPLGRDQRATLRQWRRFTRDLLDEFGTWKIITAPIAALSIVTTLFGVLLTSATTTLVLLAAVIIITWFSVLVIAESWRQERGQRLDSHAVVQRLTELTHLQQAATAYTWLGWDEIVSVTANGDTKLQQWRTIRAGEAPVSIVWTALEQTPPGNLTAARKRSVTIVAHSFTVLADGERVVGPTYDVAPVWRDDADALAVYVLFNDPVPPNATRRIVLTWDWPGFYSRLLAGAPDRIFFVRKRGAALSIRQRMVFDASCRLTDGLSVRPLEGSPMPEQHRRPDGSLVVETEYGPDAIPAVVGFIAQRSGRSPF